MELATLRVAAALEAAGIANVPLKGPLLARSLHGDPGMRFSRDIDVLVARDDLRRAVAALEPLGWRLEDGAGEPVLHLALTHGAGLPEVELHWRVHWYETEFARARPGARAARDPTASGACRPTTSSPRCCSTTRATASPGCATRPTPPPGGTRTPLRRGPPSWRPIAVEHPGLTRALSASAAVLDELVGRARRLASSRRIPSPWGARRAARLANPLMRGTPQQITAEISLVDGLLTPAGQRAAFLRRRVLVDPRQLPTRTARRPIALARVEHALRLARRMLLAAVAAACPSAAAAWARQRPLSGRRLRAAHRRGDCGVAQPGAFPADPMERVQPSPNATRPPS